MRAIGVIVGCACIRRAIAAASERRVHFRDAFREAVDAFQSSEATDAFFNEAAIAFRDAVDAFVNDCISRCGAFRDAVDAVEDNLTSRISTIVFREAEAAFVKATLTYRDAADVFLYNLEAAQEVLTSEAVDAFSEAADALSEAVEAFLEAAQDNLAPEAAGAFREAAGTYREAADAFLASEAVDAFREAAVAFREAEVQDLIQDRLMAEALVEAADSIIYRSCSI